MSNKPQKSGGDKSRASRRVIKKAIRVFDQKNLPSNSTKVRDTHPPPDTDKQRKK